MTDTTVDSVTKDAVTFTVTFDETVVGTVDTSSFTATNGTVTGVTSIGGNVWTVDVTPTAGVASGTVALSLVGTGLTDAAGNAVHAADLGSKDSQGIDTLAPQHHFSNLAITATGASDTVTGTLSAVLGTGELLLGSADNGATWTDISAKLSGTAITWDSVTLPASNTVQLEVQDLAGNRSAVASITKIISVTADPLPLATNSQGGPSLDVVLPPDLALIQQNLTGPAVADPRSHLIAATDFVIPVDAFLLQGIDNYLSTLDSHTEVTVRTIDFSASAVTSAGTITINGQDSAQDPLHQEALVIDISHLPAGTELDLQNIEFAIIVGSVQNLTIRGGAGANIVYADAANQNFVLGPGDDFLHGGGGDDYIGSLGGNDQLFGDDGNDTLSGGADNDTLTGGHGNDILDGGTGDDTAMFSGNLNDYIISFNSTTSTYTVTDKVANRDGTDLMTNVEHFHFLDQTISAPTGGVDPYAGNNDFGHDGLDTGTVVIGVGVVGLLAWAIL